MNLSQLPVYSVSQLNGYVKNLMDNDSLLSGLLVRGEISNYKLHSSGHHYFSLKDATGSLSCVMFRGDAARIRFRPANGMQVVAFGRVSVFPRSGQYQLYCNELIEDGQGALDRAFEKLKARLEAEGLFAPERKKPLPAYPRRIALVTSPTGAAVRDMLRILGARWPMTAVLVVPVRVQGEGAAEEIASAIHRVNNRADIDLIITGRGGGSREDLWAFNEEIVARAVAYSNIPVISAVGHEPDVTIADYVADLRAATPSNAAELAVPDRDAVKEQLEQLERRLLAEVRGQIYNGKNRLKQLESSRVLRNPKAPIEDARMLLDTLQRQMAAALSRTVSQRRVTLSARAAALDAMSPLKVMGRGYAIVKQGQRVVTGLEQACMGQRLDVMVSDGVLRCDIVEKEERTWQ